MANSLDFSQPFHKDTDFWVASSTCPSFIPDSVYVDEGLPMKTPETPKHVIDGYDCRVSRGRCPLKK